MKTQAFNAEEHLAEVEQWWTDHVGISHLMSKRGLVIPGVCAAWLYVDAPIAWIGWPVANPNVSPFVVHEGLSTIIKELVEEAKKGGAQAVLAFTSVTGLQKVFRRVGFMLGEEPQTTMFMGV